MIAALLAASVLGAVPAAGGTTARAESTPIGWTPAKAEVRVQADVRMPWCRVYPDWKDRYGAPVCAGGKAVTAEARAHEPLRVTNVECVGTVPSRVGYRQLRCSWRWNNSAEHGELLVIVTGPSAFRWKTL